MFNTLSPVIKRSNTISLGVKKYEEKRLHAIIENKDDQSLVLDYENNPKILASLKSMRFKEVKNEQKLLRVIGIHPEDLIRDHVTDSFTAGETHFDKKIA